MERLSAGDTAPDFILPSVSGTFELGKEVKGSYILLYFYVVNYGRTCTEYLEAMNERKNEFDSLNIKMVHINPDTAENHRQWMDRTGSLYDHLSDIDQNVSKAYGAIVERARSDRIIGYTNREFFLIDENMRIRYVWKAYWPMDTIPMNELLRELKNAIAE